MKRAQCDAQTRSEHKSQKQIDLLYIRTAPNTTDTSRRTCVCVCVEKMRSACSCTSKHAVSNCQRVRARVHACGRACKSEIRSEVISIITPVEPLPLPPPTTMWQRTPLCTAGMVNESADDDAAAAADRHRNESQCRRARIRSSVKWMMVYRNWDGWVDGTAND